MPPASPSNPVLNERIDQMMRQLKLVEAEAKDLREISHGLDKRTEILDRDSVDLRKRLDELLARRWELAKLIFAGVLGSILTLGGQLILRALDRPAGPTVAPRK